MIHILHVHLYNQLQIVYEYCIYEVKGFYLNIFLLKLKGNYLIVFKYHRKDLVATINY